MDYDYYGDDYEPYVHPWHAFDYYDAFDYFDDRAPDEGFEYDEAYDFSLPPATLFSTGDRGNKERKLWLARRCLINCSRCRYHRGENKPFGQRKAHDKRKAWRD